MARLSVIASGMVTGLGFNAPASLAALRAGISAVGKTHIVDRESGERVNGAKVDLPHWWEGVGKLADLVGPAIQECLVAAEPEPSDRIPWLIGVAGTDRPGRPEGLEQELFEELGIRFGRKLHAESRVLPMDQVGCAFALELASGLIDDGKARRVVIAGVDSFLYQPMVDAYVEKRRVMTPGNSNGFFPGEAGTAVLVGAAETHEGDELTILGSGFAREAALIDSTDAFAGHGMTAAVKQAIGKAGIALTDVAYRLTDISGEHYKFKEALFAAGRLSSGDRDDVLDLWHPIEYLGEIGAAILPCLLAQAMHAAQEGYAPGPLALCHVGSDSGERAAIVVTLRRRPGGR
jgi:3-oxoacyl-[acyl-carrier-protein] synthase-1